MNAQEKKCSILPLHQVCLGCGSVEYIARLTLNGLGLLVVLYK